MKLNEQQNKNENGGRNPLSGNLQDDPQRINSHCSHKGSISNGTNASFRTFRGQYHVFCLVILNLTGPTITPSSPQQQQKKLHLGRIIHPSSRSIIENHHEISRSIIQDSLTSPMVSVREPHLRTTANSNKIATKMAINDDGITLKICKGTWNGPIWPLGLGSWGHQLEAGLREKFHRDHGHRGDHLRGRVCASATRLALKP